MDSCFTSGVERRINARSIRPWLVPAVLAIPFLWSGAITKAMALERFEFSEPHLGTTVQITLYAPNESVANDAAHAAYERIEELNRILSDYKPDSELMQVCATAGTGKSVPVSRELFDVFSHSVAYSEESAGAFDVTIAPVVKLWRSARRLKKLPEENALSAARRLVGWKNIRLDTNLRTVELRQPGMAIDFGGLAKGYIADQTRELLQTKGIRKCLIAVAGDVSAGDPPPGADSWRIGIAPLDKPNGTPSRFLRLKNFAISTSGDAFQFVEIAGVRYSHIVDPATGLGLTRRSSVTVVAPTGIAADALATTVSVLGQERGLRLIEGTKETAAIFVLVSDTGLTTTESSRFASFVIPSDTDSNPKN